MGEITRAEVYKEQYAHFRAMNDILYKMPPIFTAILGGLWYFGATYFEKGKWLSFAIFLFALVASVCFVNVMHRFRLAFNAYIDNLNIMDGDMKVSTRPSGLPSTITTVQILLWTAAVVSLGGALYAARH